MLLLPLPLLLYLHNGHVLQAASSMLQSTPVSATSLPLTAMKQLSLPCTAV